MKKQVKIALWVLSLLVIIPALGLGGLVIYAKYFYRDITPVPYSVDELPVSGGQYAAEFAEIHQTVKEEYSLYPSKHLDMDSLYAFYCDRMPAEATDGAGFGRLLEAYFASLRVGHAFIYLKDYVADYEPAYIEGRIFVDRPNDYLEQHGFRDKDEIVEIDGVPVPEWIAREEAYQPASTEAYRKLMTARRAFRSLSDTLRRYRIARGTDTISLQVSLKEWSFFPAKDGGKPVEWKILQDSIGYIEIRSMMGPVVDEFVAAYRRVKSLPYLIVDVRNNEGGNSENGKEICEYLVRKPQPHCIAPNREITPQPEAYQGTIYLLTSPLTFSAAESFTLDMRESGNALLIGEPTAGDTGNGPQTFQTSHGICFRIPTREPRLSPQGFPLEGKGIPPHIEVVPSVADFLKDRDTVLEKALEQVAGSLAFHNFAPN